MSDNSSAPNVRAFNMLKTLSNFGSTALALNAMSKSEPGASDALLHATIDLANMAVERLRKGYKERQETPEVDKYNGEEELKKAVEEFIKNFNTYFSNNKCNLSIENEYQSNEYQCTEKEVIEALLGKLNKKCGLFYTLTFKVSFNSSNYTGTIEVSDRSIPFTSSPEDAKQQFTSFIYDKKIKLTNNENKEVYELNVKRVMGANDTTKIIFYLKSIQGSETGNEIDLCSITLA